MDLVGLVVLGDLVNLVDLILIVHPNVKIAQLHD